MQKFSWKKFRAKYRYSMILLAELVRTDFKLRYQNSTLGYLWSLLKPLFMFTILYTIFVYFLHVGKGVEHWHVALFLGVVMWEFFSEVTKHGLKVIVKQGTITRKINFPKYILVLSSSISALINLTLNLIVVGVFVVIMKVPISWSYLLIPLFILELYVFSLGCAFILSTLYVKVRDIDFIWDIVTRAGFYAVGVLFPMSRIFEKSHKAGEILLLNPVAQTLNDARHALIGDALDPKHITSQSGAVILIPLGITLLTVLVGAIYFRKKSAYFAEDV